MRSARWLLVLPIAMCLPLVVGGCEIVPVTGRSQLSFVSSAEEMQMGTEAYKEVYMAKAGYDPQAARELWVRMGEASKRQSRPPEFLSTHPSDETRVHQIDGWLPEAEKDYQPTK